MGDMDVGSQTKSYTFKCTCSKEKIVKALAGLSNKELDEIINDGKAIEVKCDFCNTTYKFSVEELKTLRKKY
ncbi:MAG: Hsp33 family molecular chaperone HslO [Eubacterium ventriosum]